MRKFSKIVEEVEQKKSFTIDANVKLTINASSEGEAAYIADSLLSSINKKTDDKSDYTINKIEENPDNLSGE